MSTTDKAVAATPGPWGTPYADTLPNGLQVLRIDSMQADGVSVIAFLPIGMGDDPEVRAIQEANARLIAEAPAMRDRILVLQGMINSVLTDSQLDHSQCGSTIRNALSGIDALLDRIDGIK